MQRLLNSNIFFWVIIVVHTLALLLAGYITYFIKDAGHGEIVLIGMLVLITGAVLLLDTLLVILSKVYSTDNRYLFLYFFLAWLGVYILIAMIISLLQV